MANRNPWECPVSRRTFFKNVAFGGGGLALALLAGERAANAQEAASVLLAGLAQNGNPLGMQLPFWGDGALWDQPQYDETIQSHRRQANKTYQKADIDGDGQDELIARSPGGILVHRYDAASGQWIQLPNGPKCSDAEGWAPPRYCRTIQCADIDGDGQAELLARAAIGIVIWKYDPAAEVWNQLPDGPPVSDAEGWAWEQYYDTIHCADLDGDGRAEIVARAARGIAAWKYDPAAQVWNQLPNGPAWSDDSGWNQPQYYSTIQSADIDGDGRAELLGRGPDGMEIFQYAPASNSWSQLPTLTNWRDDNNWNQILYYPTIQTADMNADGKAELIGRGAFGIEVYEYRPIAGHWSALPAGPAWSDAAGWGYPQYYSTIQCADVDGDGQIEIVGRSGNGIVAAKYDTFNKVWRSLPSGAFWTDAQGWNKSQYYGTILTARVRVRAAGGLTRKQAVLFGRGSLSGQTYRYDPNSRNWSVSSTRFPDFAGDQLTAYNFLTTHWRIQPPGNGVRARYNDQTGVIGQWHDELQNNLVPPPPGVPAADWKAVYSQIQEELLWVSYVQNWYGTLTAGLITDAFLGDDLSVQTVGDYLSLPGNDPNQTVLSVLSLLFGVAETVLGLPEATEALSAIAGILSAAFSASAEFLPGGGGAYSTTYAQLQADLNNSFDAVLNSNNSLQFLITGGTDSNNGNYIPADYGLLAAIGGMIDSTLWSWPDDSVNVVPAMQRSYGVSLWQALSLLKWQIYYNSGTGFVPHKYPSQYVYTDGNGYKRFMAQDTFFITLPATETLSALFDANSGDTAFPLGAPLSDVFEGLNGWNLPAYDIYHPFVPPGGLALPAPGVSVRVKGATLRRDAVTNEFLVTVTLHNQGLTGADNLELTRATLERQSRRQSALAIHSQRRTRLAPGKRREFHLRFPAADGATGKALITLSGRYRGGGFSFRLPITLS